MTVVPLRPIIMGRSEKMGLSNNSYHPGKIHMEPENHPFEKENQRFHVNFPGCIFQIFHHFPLNHDCLGERV